jgi:chlorophyll/bacteriochlorophyll a synthase
LLLVACCLIVGVNGLLTVCVCSPILYSIAGLGIAIVNDFKSIEGDRAMGLQSLPVAFGVDTAKYICAGSVTLTQLGVAAYLYAINEPLYAAILTALILPQAYFQATLLLPDPIENDVKYQASAQPFLVFGILATALCVGHHDFA